MRSWPVWFVLFFFTSYGGAADLTTLKGKKHSGELVSLDDKAVVLKTAEGEVSTPLAEILQLTLQAPPPVKFPDKYIDVEFIDGTLLHCRAFTLKGKDVQLTVLPDWKLSVPMKSVFYILTDAQDPATRKEWDTIVSERARSDRFFVRQNNRLDGLEGTFGDADADGKQIAFTNLKGEKFKFPIERFVAMLFNNRLEGNIPATTCRVNDAYKNIVVAQKATLKGASLSITTVAGVTIDYSALQAVAMLDYSKDKIVYLSDLKPSAEEKPFDELSVLYSKDVNLDNQPIQLEGVPFSKGLVIHPPLVLTYAIGGEYKEFKATIGVETSVQTPSHVRLIIEGDGRKLFEAEVKVKDKPVPVTLDIKKIRSLKIRVLPEGFPYGHQVTLADAKVTK
jgi:NPCBM/NEW2 domain